MLKKILLGVGVLVAALAAFVATRPAAYHVERSTTVAAPAGVVFAQVDDFHAWGAWSPWEKLDPAMKKQYSGAPAGEGAIYDWNGNDKVGQGRMTLLSVKRPEALRIRLEFIKPWTGTSLTEFRFQPEGAQTRVTWAMDGQSDFAGKAFSVFMPMDKMVGTDFESGLAALKAKSESQVAEAQAGTLRTAPTP